MKRVAVILVVALLAIVLVGCGSSGPQATLEKYVSALQAGDKATCAELTFGKPVFEEGLNPDVKILPHAVHEDIADFDVTDGQHSYSVFLQKSSSGWLITETFLK